MCLNVHVIQYHLQSEVLKQKVMNTIQKAKISYVKHVQLHIFITVTVTLLCFVLYHEPKCWQQNAPQRCTGLASITSNVRTHQNVTGHRHSCTIREMVHETAAMSHHNEPFCPQTKNQRKLLHSHHIAISTSVKTITFKSLHIFWQYIALPFIIWGTCIKWFIIASFLNEGTQTQSN